jgi:hypothetical protein
MAGKYDPKKTFGQEWQEKTLTGRAVKSATDLMKPEDTNPNGYFSVNKDYSKEDYNKSSEDYKSSVQDLLKRYSK